MNEAAFDLPEVGFVDRSVTYLEAPIGDGDESISLVVERASAEERDLARIVDEHIADARKRLRGYAPIHRRERTVERMPALDLAARFVDDDGSAYTRSVHLVLDDVWILIASEGPAEHRGFCDECLEHVLSTLRLRT